MAWACMACSERWQVYLIVPLIWGALLLWSKPWLERHAYGPLEWLWRALTEGQRPAMARLGDVR